MSYQQPPPAPRPIMALAPSTDAQIKVGIVAALGALTRLLTALAEMVEAENKANA